MSAMSELDAVAQGIVPIEVHLGPRSREIVNYSLTHGIPLERAMQRLMNAGLSHESESYL